MFQEDQFGVSSCSRARNSQASTMSEIGEELKAMGLPHLDFEGEGSTKYWAPTPASWDPPFEGDPTPGRAGAVRRTM